MRDSSSSLRETTVALRYLQIAAIVAMVLVGIILFAFTHDHVPLVSRSLPNVTVTDPLRQKVPHFEWSSGANHLGSAEFKGGWTLLSFWSYGCAPCLDEMPELDQFNENWSGPELNVQTINIDPPSQETTDSIREFISDNDIQLPVFYDTEGKLKSIFGVEAIPRHFLINPKGEIVWEATSAFNWSSPESEKALLTMMEREQAATKK